MARVSLRLARQRALLAGAALLLIVALAATAETPRARWAMWAIVALGAVQAGRETWRWWQLRRPS